jgi:xanthine dehydrogenase YagS FAD-binding subunit
VLEPGELITHVDVPLLPPGARSTYLKVRDRASYEFALTSAAAAVVMKDAVMTHVRLALGGVATIPWRARASEAILEGAPADRHTFRAAADAALRDPYTVPGTHFKIELAKRTIVRALETVAGVPS